MKLALIFLALVGGTGFASQTIAPSTVVKYTLMFEGGKRATIDLKGDGKSEIDCYLYANDSSPMYNDEFYGDTCHFTFNPKSNQEVYLLVKNSGKNADHITLIAD